MAPSADADEPSTDPAAVRFRPGDAERRNSLGQLGQNLAGANRAAGTVQQDGEQVKVWQRALARAVRPPRRIAAGRRR